MDTKTKCIEVPIFGRSNSALTNQYAIQIYSGEKVLRMLIDTGAEYSSIGNIPLRGCVYHNTKQTSSIIGLGGIANTMRRVLLEFNLEKSNVGSYLFGIDFDVIPKKLNSYFNCGDLDGILGTNFLRYCDIDLVNGVLNVFVPEEDINL